MDSIRLLKEIFSHKQLREDIVYYYERVELKKNQLNEDYFIKIMTKHNIHIHPSILFIFFDSIGIKIVTFPVGQTEDWGSKTYYNGNVLVSNDYPNRHEATLGGLKSAIVIYNTRK